MQVVYERCWSLDVHKRTVVACRIIPESPGQLRPEIRTFATMTQDLLALVDWLQEAGVTHVAMESTGVYWWPIYNLLEAQFTLLVVNARHLKAVPGRKTDVKDAEWISQLLHPPARRKKPECCHYHQLWFQLASYPTTPQWCLPQASRSRLLLPLCQEALWCLLRLTNNEACAQPSRYSAKGIVNP